MSEQERVMRIIAGKYRHRKIYWPTDPNIRPTKDRIREAVFSALGDLSSFSFLDLYAGSGAMGLEAISRGASFVAFNDMSPTAISCIQTNIKELNITEPHQVLLSDDISALNKFKKENVTFDIIFMDPPYKDERYIEVISKIIADGILSSRGIIICESNHPLNVDESWFSKVKVYKYGEIFVTMYRR